MATQTLEAMAAALEASGHYRILRRLDVANACSLRVDGAETRIACVVDVETSGLNVASDEIIQLAIMPFRYTTKDARVVEVLHDFSGYRQPSRPISRAITELTGIDDAMVLGRRIDPNDVAAFMAEHAIDFAVAHNMKFDREFLQRAFPEPFANCLDAGFLIRENETRSREMSDSCMLRARSGRKVQERDVSGKEDLKHSLTIGRQFAETDSR